MLEIKDNCNIYIIIVFPVCSGWVYSYHTHTHTVVPHSLYSIQCSATNPNISPSKMK